MKHPSLLHSPVPLKVLLTGTDTFLVNYKFIDEQGTLSGAALPGHIIEQLDDWQKEARKEHAPVPTPLTFRYALGEHTTEQTLCMRSHGSSVWSWLLFADDVWVDFAPGTLNKGLFCQARFSSHLLHTIGPELATVQLEAMLYDFLGELFHKQASEVHLCCDLQGFDFSTLRLVGEQLPFVSRVTTIRDRVVAPTDLEQEGGLSPQGMAEVERQIASETAALDEQETHVQPASLSTTHRRIATIDFGSHASPVSAQIYNKSLEIQVRKKQWFEPLWLANGWDGESEVWRVEFRFRRSFLRTYDLNEAFDLLKCLRLLWQYATEHWLRFVDADQAHGVNVSRIPLHPVWECIQHAYDTYGAEDEPATHDAQGEQAARAAYAVQEKPLEVITQTVALQAEAHEAAHALASVSADLAAIVESLQDEPLDVLRVIAQEQLDRLTPGQVAALVEQVTPVAFEEVRTGLVKRSRRMAKLKACVAGALGYLRSAVALMPPDELPGFLGPDAPASRTVPDLLSSLLWFYGKARDEDDKKHRVHALEVQKKRLLYGFLTAYQLEEERRVHGVDLAHEDDVMIDQVLKDFHRSGKRQDLADDELYEA